MSQQDKFDRLQKRWSFPDDRLKAHFCRALVRLQLVALPTGHRHLDIEAGILADKVLDLHVQHLGKLGMSALIELAAPQDALLEFTRTNCIRWGAKSHIILKAEITWILDILNELLCCKLGCDEIPRPPVPISGRFACSHEFPRDTFLESKAAEITEWGVQVGQFFSSKQCPHAWFRLSQLPIYPSQSTVVPPPILRLQPARRQKLPHDHLPFGLPKQITTSRWTFRASLLREDKLKLFHVQHPGQEDARSKRGTESLPGDC